MTNDEIRAARVVGREGAVAGVGQEIDAALARRMPDLFGGNGPNASNPSDGRDRDHKLSVFARDVFDPEMWA